MFKNTDQLERGLTQLAQKWGLDNGVAVKASTYDLDELFGMAAAMPEAANAPSAPIFNFQHQAIA